MKRKIILLICSLLISGALFAQPTYYVNAGIGDDSYTPMEAQNPETPWATLTHAISEVMFGTVEVHGTLTEQVHEQGMGQNPGGGIYVNQSITIQGTGPDETIIQPAILPGNASNRVFYIAQNQRVTIKDLSIRYGNTTYPGGGIANASDNLTLENVKITECQASAGGGIFNISNLDIKNVTVASNTADSCAGIFNYNEGGMMSMPFVVSIENSIVKENKATKGPCGGIASIADGDVSITLDVTGTQITNNASTVAVENDSLQGGGGIYLSGNSNFPNIDATINDCSIDGNTTNGTGGGILLKFPLADPLGINISGSAIINNVAGHAGGGLANLNAANDTIKQSTFSGNTTKGNGGAVYNTGEIIMSHSTIAKNTCNTNDDETGDGAGVFNHGGTLVLTHNIIAANMDGSTSGNVYPDVCEQGGTITTNGYNLIGDNSGSSSFPEGNPNGNDDYAGTSSGNLDPLLNALTDNGGKTKTHALQNASPAVDAGDSLISNPPNGDQRGENFPRIQDGDEDGSKIIDIGAYELADPNSPEIFTDSSVVDADSAILYGSVDPKDQLVQNLRFAVRYTYPSFMPEEYDTITAIPDSAQGTVKVSVNAILNDLETTTYYYKLMGSYDGTTYFGDELSFEYITDINLDNVDINVRDSTLIFTENTMEYQINGGEWKDCSNMTTEGVSFEPGDVVVRQKNKPSNSRIVYTIAEPGSAPEYTIDYMNETTAENVPATDSYSTDNFENDVTNGTGTPVELNVPDYGETDGHLYFRTNATQYELASQIQDLVIPARNAAPIVSLSEKGIENARFVKSADGTGDTVTATDGYEYTIDVGATWNDIEDATVVDASVNDTIYARIKATDTTFASTSTGNLNGPLDLGMVDVNVAQEILTNTLTTMEYSLNSTDGLNGDWSACENSSTTVSFIEGDVYVREASDPTNNRLVATIIKQEKPSYSIDYENETTDESIPSTDEYSYDLFATDGTDGNGQPLSLSVPEYGEGSDTVYFRTKANDTALTSDIQALEIPERPAPPAYSIDYSAETTAEAISVTDEYSLDTFATAGTQGDGTDLNLSGLIPAYGSNDEYVYFRSLATASSFVSSVQNLVVPARTASPVVSLSDQSSAGACFVKSADGTGDTVSTADGYEYTLDQGSTWDDILDATTIDSRGDQDIRVRVKATATAFASESTSNLDGDLNLSNVSANVAEGLLLNTLTTMQYSLNSTDGTDGDWYDCSNTSTSVVFVEGQVYVRERANTSNYRLVIQVQKADPPSVSINYEDETSDETIPSTVIYSNDNFASDTTTGTGMVIDLNVPSAGNAADTLYFMTKANASELASEVVKLTIPARPAAPSILLSDQDSPDAVFVKSGNDTVATSDGMEYSTDGGAVWYLITDTTTIDSRGDQDIRVRVQATASAFASESTSNLDGDLNLSNVSANVAEGLLLNTLTTMQYSLNSTDGTDGDWYDCSNTSTSVVFVEGQVYVRERANTSNYRLVIQVQKADPPSVSINYEDETSDETIPSTVIYSNDNFASDTTTGTGMVIDLNVPSAGNAADTLYFMTKANASELASEVVKLTIPARPAAPSILLSDQDSPDAVFVKSGNDTVATSDGMEYSTDGGAVWYLITDTTTVNTSGNNNIIARKKATASSFASESTDNLDIITEMDQIETGISIYPNPVINDVIHFTNIEDAVVWIYSTNGRMLMAKQMNYETKINVSDLQNGTYIMVISQNGKIYKKTFIVF
jgi:hypothetical protein